MNCDMPQPCALQTWKDTRDGKTLPMGLLCGLMVGNRNRRMAIKDQGLPPADFDFDDKWVNSATYLHTG